jgi:glycosyltransferase involved in cell wall biosynthesis
MTQTPSVSVLIPTYNRASYLGATLKSIFSQTVPVDEVLLVDDGSTDETQNEVALLIDRHPEWRSRLVYSHQANQGKSVALNHALSRARGAWIAFDDSDDCWWPDKLEWQFRALAQYPECRACFTDASYSNNPTYDSTSLKEAGVVYQDIIGKENDFARLFIRSFPVFMQTIVVRRDALHQCGGFHPKLRVEQDVDFMFRLGLITSLCYVNRALVVIDRTAHRMYGLTTQFSLQSRLRIQARELRLESWSQLVAEQRPDLLEEVEWQLRCIRSSLANSYIASGETYAARVVLRRAMRDRLDWRLAVKWALTFLSPWLVGRLTSWRVGQLRRRAT